MPYYGGFNQLAGLFNAPQDVRFQVGNVVYDPALDQGGEARRKLAVWLNNATHGLNEFKGGDYAKAFGDQALAANSKAVWFNSDKDNPTEFAYDINKMISDSLARADKEGGGVQEKAPAPVAPIKTTTPTPPAATAPAAPEAAQLTNAAGRVDPNPDASAVARTMYGQQGTYGGPKQPKTAEELIAYMMQGHDPKNLSTRGMDGGGRAFSFGGVTYDPTKDTGRQYRGMGKGKAGDGITNRGAAWNNFIYTMDLLNRQRKGKGNAAYGVTKDTTDEQLAQIAMGLVNKRNTGSTGLTAKK